MTTHDSVESGEGGQEWGESVWSPARRDELLRVTCQADPPRRFALCEELCDEHGEAAATRRVFTVFAWGLAYPDGAVLSGGRVTAGSFRSAQRALDLFGRNRAPHLYWLDPEPAGLAGPAAGN
ncbi:MAG TPA: hypothetical protein VFX70_22260 [Mycobacteriales bacterium]|nr:hypothetical protein [Mycobacteriales bacterium]